MSSASSSTSTDGRHSRPGQPAVPAVTGALVPDASLQLSLKQGQVRARGPSPEVGRERGAHDAAGQPGQQAQDYHLAEDRGEGRGRQAPGGSGYGPCMYSLTDPRGA